jgi:site-specific DNA-methyltransferase (adenine-specific)
MEMKKIILGDCKDILPTLPDKFARMIMIDSPFNTNKKQTGGRLKTTASEAGTREGFQGKTYEVEHIEGSSYEDTFEDFPGFLMPRIEAALHTLTTDGRLFVHLDYREVHYIKVALDKLLGRDHFMNEIIWSYDFGGRSKSKWSCKHDTILWYVLDPKNYIFNFEEMDRIPYLAPGLVGEEKAARGKTPTDCFWHTIAPTNGPERTGYPTQKPMGVLNRFVKVHTKPDDVVLDFFAGSGTTLHAAANNGRGFIGIDANPEACSVMEKRLRSYEPECIGFTPTKE